MKQPEPEAQQDHSEQGDSRTIIELHILMIRAALWTFVARGRHLHLQLGKRKIGDINFSVKTQDGCIILWSVPNFNHFFITKDILKFNFFKIDLTLYNYLICLYSYVL